MTETKIKRKKRAIKSMGLVWNQDGNPKMALEVEIDEDVEGTLTCPDCGSELVQREGKLVFDCENSKCNVVSVRVIDGQIQHITRNSTFMPKAERSIPKRGVN